VSPDVLLVEGIVEHVGRGDLHTVRVQLGAWKRTVLAKRSGRLVKHKIKIVEGDVVRVEVNPFDVTRGRIVHRVTGSRP
jgi:translation initiation factor IF-1